MGFGFSSSKNSSSGSFNKTSESNPWDKQEGYITDGFKQSSDWLANNANPNANMNAGWSNQLGQMGAMQGVANTAAQGNQWLGSTDQLNPNSNPYLQQSLDMMGNQVNQQLQNSLNTVNQDAAGAGMFGGARQGVAQGLAIQGAQDTIGQNANSMLMSNYNQGAQNMLQSQQMSPQIQQGLGNAGQMQTQIGHQQQQAPIDNINKHWGIVGGNNWGGTETSSGTQQSKGKSGGMNFGM